ncbi:MAG: hypothetical protein WBE90_28340 [Xanthobacteraceae bacterium]
MSPNKAVWRRTVYHGWHQDDPRTISWRRLERVSHIRVRYAVDIREHAQADRVNRELVMNVMQGFVETIHLFKTRSDIVIPLLQRYLNIEDRKAAEDLYAFHVPVFQKVPRPSLSGMQTLRGLLTAKYPAAASLKESEIADPSFIDELEQNGFIDRLYAADRK